MLNLFATSKGKLVSIHRYCFIYKTKVNNSVKSHLSNSDLASEQRQRYKTAFSIYSKGLCGVLL